jgi:hypothetical protein
MKNLHKLLKGEHIFGLTNVHFEKDRICSACQAGKQVGVHHPHKNIMTTRRHHMNSSPVKSPMFHILKYLVANISFLLKEVENLNLLLRL